MAKKITTGLITILLALAMPVPTLTVSVGAASTVWHYTPANGSSHGDCNIWPDNGATVTYVSGIRYIMLYFRYNAKVNNGGDYTGVHRVTCYTSDQFAFGYDPDEQKFYYANKFFYGDGSTGSNSGRTYVGSTYKLVEGAYYYFFFIINSKDKKASLMVNGETKIDMTHAFPTDAFWSCVSVPGMDIDIYSSNHRSWNANGSSLPQQ